MKVIIAGSRDLATTVVNKRIHWPSPADYYIGRPSVFGNPYSHLPNTLAKYRVGTRDEAVRKYEEWLTDQPTLMDALDTLQGKTLVCWCNPAACHGDILARLADDAFIDRVVISTGWKISEVVCGMARGVDMMGRAWAHKRGIPVKEMHAEWDKYGVGAGCIRNRQMAEYGEALLAITNGSPGTANMIAEARKLGLLTQVLDVPHGTDSHTS